MKRSFNFKALLLSILLSSFGWTGDLAAQKAKPTMKPGAYYFSGLAGKCPYYDLDEKY